MMSMMIEDSAGGIVILAEGKGWDVSAVIDGGAGLADLISAHRGDAEDWTVPTIEDAAELEAIQTARESKVVAEYDGRELAIHVDLCGHAAKEYLRLEAWR